MDDFQHIIYEAEAGRARITLNRAEKRNALSVPLLEELNAALWEADNDKDVHCVILRGAGSCFSAGYDLTPGLNNPPSGGRPGRTYRDGGIYADPTIDDDIWRLEYSQRLRMVLFDMHKPSIAQVHGYCLAGGMELSLICDIRICSTNAQFGLPEIVRGFFPGCRMQGACICKVCALKQMPGQLFTPLLIVHRPGRQHAANGNDSMRACLPGEFSQSVVVGQPDTVVMQQVKIGRAHV